MKSVFLRGCLAPFLLLGIAFASETENENDNRKGKGSPGGEKSFAEIVENCDLLEGLFNLYRDRDDGTVYLAVRNEQIDTEFIHFAYVLDGIPDLGLFRGRFLREQIVSVRRHYDRIEFVGRNTGFYFDPENALSRAADANISDAVLVSEKIVATTEDKTTHLVEAGDIFLREYLAMVKPSRKKEPKADDLVLGDLSKDRTRFTDLRNYPENTLLRVDYVFENERPKEWGEDEVTDARFITISVQHALIAVPENDYRPRLEDPRVGYFTTRNTDLTSKKSANYRDLIHRWHLRKKNPGAEKSDPVEPIVWWIENTTPVELRDAIREGVEAWNLAFESAGFTNAVVCRVQPDDADWDAGDIRYNVLRWTSSPDPPFGGYGPSFVNPRTGQIIGADIMLEYVYVTNRIRLSELLQRSGPVEPLRAGDRFPFDRIADPGRGRGGSCLAGHFRQENAISARASLTVAGASRVEMDALIEEALIDLILHEIGHTLGLSHNFIASTLHGPDEIHDEERTGRLGVVSSVMDYSPANIARDRDRQGQFYSIVPGPYDHWAIRYGYSESTPEGEDELLAGILSESTKPAHAFGNDADDMRAPGRGIDPRIMINDLTSDPIGHAVDTMERVRETMAGLAGSFPVEGEGYHELRTAFASLLRDYRRSAEILTRYVGGVEIDRSVHGQEGAAAAPFVPVPAATQERALEVLESHVFGPDGFAFLPTDLIALLQLRRRGFDHAKLDANEDPKIHSAIAEIHGAALDHLLHRNTLNRLVDSGLYGESLGLAEAMERLDTAIMTGDRDSFREACQVDYVKRLVALSGLAESSDHGPHAQGVAVHLLEGHLATLEGLPRRTPHESHLRRLIANALEGR